MLPIGAAILNLKGGVLRAEQSLDSKDPAWILEERNELYRRLERFKVSVKSDTTNSYCGHVLRRNSINLVDEAEDLLCRLTDELIAAMVLLKG